MHIGRPGPTGGAGDAGPEVPRDAGNVRNRRQRELRPGPGLPTQRNGTRLEGLPQTRTGLPGAGR